MNDNIKTPKKGTNAGRIQRLSLYIFDRPKRTACLALIVVIFGIVCFTTLMRREGFPNIDVPYAMGQVVYIADNPETTDALIAKPLSERIAKDDDVKTVTTRSLPNYVVVIIQYKSGINSETKTKQISKYLVDEKILPSRAKAQLSATKNGFTEQGDDFVLTLFDSQKADIATSDIAAQGSSAVDYIKSKASKSIKSVSLIDPINLANNPSTGQSQKTQTKFERYVVNENGHITSYHAVAIGIKKSNDADTIKLDNELHNIADSYNQKSENGNYQLAVTASFARSVRQQMSELGRTLLEGLIAILIIGSIVIAVRASLITVASMVLVILSSFGVLYLIGYTLNTIVLFSLILGLALIVDDTIIMVEAIDKERRRTNDRRKIIANSTNKIARAMIAATTTAALSFTPLFFVNGIIGDFVRAVPTTIICSLLVSLLVALFIIPLLARAIMLGKSQIGRRAKSDFAEKAENAVANFISRPILWSRGRRSREVSVGLAAILISFVFIASSVFIFTKIKFNIFPPSKDSNEIAVTLAFPQNTDILEAEQLADSSMQRVSKVLGKNLQYAVNDGETSATSAWFEIYLTDYSRRDTSSQQMVAALKESFKNLPEGVSLTARTIDVGPPPSAFEARVSYDNDKKTSVTLANDIVNYLKTHDIRRNDGSNIRFDTITVNGEQTPIRAGGKSYISVTATYVDDDTSAEISSTQSAIEAAFPASKVSSYGLSADSLSYDFGMEEDNQNSFRALLFAFPIVLLVIFVVLAFEFRSFLQPLLIFMAVPFSLFGVMLGLYLTDNAFSFFAMLGFFALIGLSIKNTILLTDYANRARREGKGSVDAIHEALTERFRPLIATSLTAVVSLIPLAAASPFWQGLSVVLIGGLLSSTLLVVTIFPYYYLAAEFLRTKLRFNKKAHTRGDWNKI